jgi:hypothetical protein
LTPPSAAGIIPLHEFESSFAMSKQLLVALIVSLMILACDRPGFGQRSVRLTKEELDGAAGDTTNHFGDSPNTPAPPATDLDGSLSSRAVKAVMQKVADWQLLRAEKYFSQQWTFGALYSGLMQVTPSTGDPKFQDAMLALGEKYKWDISGSVGSAADDAANNAAAADFAGGLGGPDNPPPTDPAVLAEMRRTIPINANSECLAQTYLDLYAQFKNPWMLDPTRNAFDAIIKINTYPTTLPSRGGRAGGFGGPPPQAAGGRGRGRGGRGGASTRPSDQGMDPELNPHHLIWWWCDALYMGPPAWARLYAATGDVKYLDYLDHQWWQSSQYLYDPAEHLFYRDNSFLAKHEPNGAKVFWSRGEGWVIAGLARVLQVMPEDYPDRPRFVTQFKEMAAKIASLQGDDGLWRSGMLDPDYYGLPENSGSSFFAYALAWGVNQNILDRDTYVPVVAKAWKGLVSHVHADGRLDCIQQTGAGPAHYKPSSSYVYGVGAFLMAGREINRLSIMQAMEHRR